MMGQGFLSDTKSDVKLAVEDSSDNTINYASDHKSRLKKKGCLHGVRSLADNSLPFARLSVMVVVVLNACFDCFFHLLGYFLPFRWPAVSVETPSLEGCWRGLDGQSGWMGWEEERGS